jgi:hypothetical protein
LWGGYIKLEFHVAIEHVDSTEILKHRIAAATGIITPEISEHLPQHVALHVKLY